MMRRKDDKADLLVKMYLSFFTLSKVVILAKRVNASTFASLILSEPWDDTDSVLSMVGDVKMSLPALIRRYVPLISEIPLDQGRGCLGTRLGRLYQPSLSFRGCLVLVLSSSGHLLWP